MKKQSICTGFQSVREEGFIQKGKCSERRSSWKLKGSCIISLQNRSLYNWRYFIFTTIKNFLDKWISTALFVVSHQITKNINIPTLNNNKKNLGGNKQWWIIMHVNVLVECRDSHAYPSVTQEKIIKIAKDMHNGISSVTYRRGELVTRQWCGWDLCTTHREWKRKKEQNRGDRKKEWKSEMNDGGNLGFPAMTLEVGGWKWAGPRGAATRSQLKDGKCMELMAQAAPGNVDGEKMYQKPTGWLV